MELRRVAPVVGLVVLLAADAVLIGWAFRPAPADGYVPAAASSTTATSSARPTSSASPTKKFEPPKVAPVEQFISAVGPQIAWVVRGGSCAHPDVVWVTADQGDSWEHNGVPGRVLRLIPDSAKTATAVGGDTKCALKLWKSTDSGADWGVPQSAAGAWVREPDDAKAVHTPTDQVKRPCGARDVIDLAVLDASRATVLCDNGDIRATKDGGQRWPSTDKVKNALAITVAEGGTGVVVKADPRCQGVVALPIVSGKAAAEGECVEAPTTDGRISVSTAAGGWWLLVGSQVFTAEEAIGPWTRTQADAAG